MGRPAKTLLVPFLVLASSFGVFAQSGDATRADLLLPLERAFVQAAGADWKHASEQLEAFATLWHMQSLPASRPAGDVESALNGAALAAAGAAAAPERVPPAFQALAKALAVFRESARPAGTGGADPQLFAALSAAAAHGLDFAQDSRPSQAAAAVELFDALWSIDEDSVHAQDIRAYVDIEAGIDSSLAALQAAPPDLSRARDALTGLLAAVKAAPGSGQSPLPASAAGTAAAPGIPDLVGRLRSTEEALSADNPREAIDRMQGFISAWPLAEGVVKTRSEDAYRQTEEDMTEAAGLLLSGPSARARAADLIRGMMDRLGKLEQAGAVYTAWDAGMILLREGMEALLVLAALLAMLRRSQAPRGAGWVWSGAGAGLLISCLLAVLLVFAVSQTSAGGAREKLEGFVGLASVALMVTVGAWLHRRSGLQSWNAFIKGRVGGALAAGSMWSLFALACLAVLREGAESVVFYIGIAGSIPIDRLLAGIGGALAILIVAGFLIIRFSVKLPLRWFFLAATLLIYYLAFKIAGESIHSLQVAGILSSHEQAGLPSIPALGVFSTWETFLPQAAVLALVLAEMLVTELRRSAARKSPTERPPAHAPEAPPV